MPTNPGLLARIFKRSGKNPVVSKLYTHALGQPLLVHPSIGERLIGAYLEGAMDSPSGEVSDTAGAIAVLNISGALVNRPMPGLCGPGPVSYAEIRCAFDAALADDNIKAIVFRVDSPGGMASGCFDLTDYIFANNQKNGGPKPVLAQIDDMAFSGAYAIAAACDSIQVTRTGGGGSVGAYTYHVDYSGANAKAGVVVTYIFAGAKKVDGNPDAPLSDSAKADAQKGIDQLYVLFTESVAKYRGMAVADVVATQADCYNGGDLILVGFADSLGTLDDLLAKLSQPQAPETPEQETEDMADPTNTPTPAPAPAAPVVTATLTAEQTGQIARAAITDAVMAATPKLRSDIAVALLASEASVTVENVAERITHARQVADLCTAAKLNGSEIGYVTRNTPIESVRAELAAAVADPSPELVTALPLTDKTNKGASTSRQDVYSRRRAAAAGNGTNRGNQQE